jgi:outer membrane protein assembly factor BamB
MWTANVNVGGGSGRLHMIGMDGIGSVETLNIDRHHDFCVLPDNSIAYIEFENDGTGTCDKIMERSASGTTTEIYRIRDDFSALAGSGGMGGEWCHSNAIHYVPSQEAYYVSVLNQNMIIKFSRGGDLEWALDGDGNTVSGVNYLSGVNWSRQHGHHALDDGTLFIFNNGEGGFGGGGSSYALKFSIDEGANSASQTWQYNGGSSSQTFGDVQQMSNGNILIVYSNAGVMHEVSAGATNSPIRTITAGGLGYAEARRSLYGLPDRY